VKLAVFLNGSRLLRAHQVESKLVGLNPDVAMLLYFSKIMLNILEKRLMVVEKL
jgi:anti-anti-sigma regulatory factor